MTEDFGHGRSKTVTEVALQATLEVVVHLALPASGLSLGEVPSQGTGCLKVPA